jgi:Tol biopolymer transport system component
MARQCERGGFSTGLPTDWSRDGRFILFDSGIPEEGPDVWIADVSARTIQPLLRNKFPEWGAAFAPTDRKQLAFVTAESGRPEVYLQAFEDAPSPAMAGERHQVSRDGGWIVRWRADGRELYYLGMDNWLYAVPVTGKLQAGEPQRLFRVPGTSQYATTSDFQFDVSPDGQRFLMSTTGSAQPPAYTVIQNWQDKIQR